MFRRRKNAETSNEGADPAADQDAAALAEAADPAADAVPAERGRPQGPWDVDDVPDDGLDRLDLGGLQLPVPPGTEVRVDVNPQGQVVAATLVSGPSAMQVSAFAAPRRAGIWDEVRTEISEQLTSGGGRAVDAEGPFGTELHAAVPTEVPGKGRMLAPARFLGVDGPRWFLRALLTGPAAMEATAAVPLLAALQSAVVVRGSEAMAVRDPLALRLPANAAAAAAAAMPGAGADTDSGTDSGTDADADADAGPDTGVAEPDPPTPRLAPPERGPEIAELR